MGIEHHHVFLEEGDTDSLNKSMINLHAWFDLTNINPVGFERTVTSSGSIIVQLTFTSRNEAKLFEEAFFSDSASVSEKMIG